MPRSPDPNHGPDYAIAMSPATDNANDAVSTIEGRAIGAKWIVYTSAGIAMLEAFHYGWSSHQINLHKFHNVEDCAARPIEEDTCIMFPGHTKTTWTLLSNAWLVGGMIGSFLSGIPSNKYGRRMTLRFNTIVMVLASVIQILAPTAAWFGVGRFVAGIANGIAMAVVNTFLSEISTPHNRHALGTNTHLAATLGILGVATTFWYWNTTSGFRWIAGVPIVLAAGYLVCSYFFMVESPVWLVAKGREDEAERELARLYGKEHVEAMMSWIQARDHRTKLPSTVSGESVQMEAESPWTILAKPKFRKQLVVALGLTCINQLVGINAVFWYSSSILTEAGIADARLGVAIIDILNVVPVPIAAYATQFLPKRAMLLWGIALMSVCCIGMTLSMVYGVGWLSVTMLGIYVVGYDVSIGPLLWPMIAEFFPDSARGGAVGICVFLKWVCALIIGIAFPYIQDAITDYSFTPFLATTILSIVFIYFMVPETSDLTIAEIQSGFRGDENLHSVKSQQ
uniref:Hexose transporter 1 n=1 Tax=Phytophthora ramorum TaxID=164328 RepID=H3GFA4_PHYRM